MFEKSTDEIEFDVKMSAGILYDFSLYHVYRSPVGILGTIVGILLIVYFGRTRELLYLAFGIVVILYLPVTLFFNCKKQMLLTPSYKEALHYRVSKDGIEVSQGEVTQGHDWGQVIRAVGTPKSLFIYTGKNVATIFPREAMGSKTESVIKTISKYVEPSKVKIRF